jgi:hypothetical protein
MQNPAPLIVKRSFKELVEQTEKLLVSYSSWRPEEDGDQSARALIHIFCRLAELVVDRLNQVPDKNFLAFLDLVGLELMPPQPARVPLTFRLATGSTTDAVVPAQTLVAAVLEEGETEPVIFETERNLVVSRSHLVYAFTREPGRDLYCDNKAAATGQTEDSFPVFQGDLPIPHRLFVSHHELFAIDVLKSVTLRFEPASIEEPWPWAVDWTYWDGEEWKPLSLAKAPSPTRGGWEITLSNVPAISTRTVGKLAGGWLRGEFRTNLPRGELITVDADSAQYDLRNTDLPPDALLADLVRLDASRKFYPFGNDSPRLSFYVANDEVFSKPGGQVAINVFLDSEKPAQPSADLVLVWEYWDGSSWQELGQSSATDSSITESDHDFTDETHAFTRGDTIRFVCPIDWESRDISNVRGLWLRVRIVKGDYGPDANRRAPIVEKMILSYEWPLPRVDTIQTKVHIERNSLALDFAFTNQLSVDPSKDFFPFGEKPKVGDTLYIANDETFSKPNARVSFEVGLTNPSDENKIPPPAVGSADLRLTWEFWNGREGKWDVLGESGKGAERESRNNFTDGTEGLVKEGRVTFTCPETSAGVEVNGQRRHWIRVRIAAGNYGVEARYEPVLDKDGKVSIDPDTGMPIYRLVPATFRPPSIKSVTLSYDFTSPYKSLTYTQIENDFIVEDCSETAAEPGQFFNPFTLPRDKQPVLYLGFHRPGADTGFANESTTLYFGVPDILYDEMRSQRRPVIEEAVVVWEYWNGSRWARLGTRDETQSFTRRGLVTFIGPADFRASTEFCQKAFWLRARWDRGEYASLPRLRRVLTNTMWAVNATTVQNEILGSSNGEQNQVFRTAKSPVLEGQRVEIREPEMPSAAEREKIEDEEGDDAISTKLDPSGRPIEIWVRWHPVLDFHESGPWSRHYTLDRLTGEIRFGEGRRGMVPPQARANVRVTRYLSGGGPQGNRAAETITQLKSSVPNVESVINWEPAAGGSPPGTLENVKNQGPKTLRHRFRSVVIADFEDLAFEASTNVARVQGIPAQDQTSAGSVGLIVVPHSTDPQPIPSLELLGRVEDYIIERLMPTVDLWVAGPDWLQVTVTAEIVPVSMTIVADVQTAVLDRLATFLHPLTGGLDRKGWAFGRRPYRSDLHALLESAPGVDHVRRLIVTEEGEVRPDRFLVYSGDHQITMVGTTD